MVAGAMEAAAAEVTMAAGATAVAARVKVAQVVAMVVAAREGRKVAWKAGKMVAAWVAAPAGVELAVAKVAAATASVAVVTAAGTAEVARADTACERWGCMQGDGQHESRGCRQHALSQGWRSRLAPW